MDAGELAEKMKRAASLMQAAGSEPLKTHKGLEYYTVSKLKSLPPTKWLIWRIIPADALCNMFGACASFKTLTALDLVMHIALGLEYYGFATTQTAVLYILAEGKGDIQDRITAWCLSHDVPEEMLENKVFFITQPAALNDADMLAEILQTVANIKAEHGADIGLIVVDTVNRNMRGDENSTKDMTEFVAACDKLRTQVGCSILLIHHTGHGDTTRARGSSVLVAALDSEIMITREGLSGKTARGKPRGKGLTLRVSKLRSAEDNATLKFKTERIVVDPASGRDSLYLVPVSIMEAEELEEAEAPALTKEEELLLQIYNSEPRPSKVCQIDAGGRKPQAIHNLVTKLKLKGYLDQKIQITRKGRKKLAELALITDLESTESH